MFALAVIAQANAIEATFAPPPHRSTGPGRRNRKDAGFIASLVRGIRRALALAADDVSTPWLPRLSNYPY